MLELAQDGCLSNLMKKRRKCYTDEEASQIMKSVLLAVKYMHEMNIVHRDIKPGYFFSSEKCM